VTEMLCATDRDDTESAGNRVFHDRSADRDVGRISLSQQAEPGFHR